MNQELKQIIAANLKPVLAKYNVKGSLRVDHSEIILTLRQGKLNLQNDWRNPKYYDHRLDCFQIQTTPYYTRWPHETYWSGQSFSFFEEAKAALLSAGYYDKSDIMTDYHDVAYYWDIEIKDYKYIGD